MSDDLKDPSSGIEPEATPWATVSSASSAPIPVVVAPPVAPSGYAPVSSSPPPATYAPVQQYPPAGLPPLQPVQPKKKSKTWVWVLLGVFTVIVLGIVGCIAAVVHLAHTAGSDSAIALHLKMQTNDLAGIFAASDPAYQDQVGRAKSDALFTRVHDALGSPVSGTQTSVNIDNDVKTLVNAEHFEKGDGTETMKFHKGTDGVYRLLGYDVKSPALLQTPAADAPATDATPSDATPADGGTAKDQ